MVDIGRVHSAPPAVRRAEPPVPLYPSSPPPASAEGLAEARARMELREVVTRQDALDAELESRS